MIAAERTGNEKEQKAQETGVLVSTVANAGAEERGLVLGMVKANEKVRETEKTVSLLEAEVVEEKRRRARAEEKMRGTEERVRQLQSAIAEMEEEKRRRVEAEEKIRETESLMTQSRQKDEITIGGSNLFGGKVHGERLAGVGIVLAQIGLNTCEIDSIVKGCFFTKSVQSYRAAGSPTVCSPYQMPIRSQVLRRTHVG